MTGTPDLPEGTLTLLFSDIEGSTRLLADLGPRYGEVLSAQRAVLRRAFAGHGGREMGTEGDSFFVVFRTAREAVAAAVEAQRALAATPWPPGGAVLVRMGLHTGEPVRHEDGYVGMDVHRAARVAAGAHGGQILLSDATYRIVSGSPPPGTRLRDLGTHRLKDLPGPERLHQVDVAGLPTDFPPVRSLGSASSLPRPTTALVGRTTELDALGALLRDPSTRLVTLTGPAGTGKTRLAIGVAGRLEADLPDGVYFVPLAPVSSADVMWTTIGEVLGVTGENKAPPTFVEHLADRRLLLVLDNLEQLADAALVVTELIGAGPGVQVLATSRRPLHLAGEHEWPVPPLPVDEDGPGGAVELFVARARLVRPALQLSAQDLDDVREICRRLDGLPLAIELVAARAKLLGPRALLARLDRLEAPGRTVDVPERQRSLRSALQWSHELLPARLQVAFRALAVMSGEFDLAAAGAVLGPGTDALEVVAELVDVSLLTADEGADGEPRLRMLRTIGLYGRELLDLTDESDEVHERHAAWFASLAETLCPRLRTADHLATRSRLERELENLRAALAWCLSPLDGGRPPAQRLDLGLRLCRELSWFWYGCGYHAEGRRWLQLAVDAAAGAQTPEAMSAVHGLAILVLQQGQAERARDLLEACLAFRRAAGDPAAISVELNSLGVTLRALEDPGGARRLLDEAVATARTAGDKQREATAVSNLAALAVDRGDSHEAIRLLERALELDTELEDVWGQMADQVNLSGALLRAGRVDEARDTLVENAAACVALGDVEITIDVIGLLAAVHAVRGDAHRAARLLGASEAMRDQAELPLPAPDAAWLASVMAPRRAETGGRVWDEQVGVGRAFSVETALEDGLRFSAGT